jgi:hypothetical protein
MRWNKWLEMVKRQGKWMNKQDEMKQMIRYGGKDSENGWISKLRWNKWLDNVGKTEEIDK